MNPLLTALVGCNVYGAFAGLGYFVGAYVNDLLDNPGEGPTPFFTGVWPVLLPAVLVYWFCYTRTEKYRLERLDEAEQRLRRVQREVDSLLSEEP